MFFLAAVVSRPTIASAQSCDPTQGLTFSFLAPTQVTSLAIKQLHRKTARSAALVGAGTFTLGDGTVIPLAVAARTTGTSTVTYRLTGRTATWRARGSVVVDGCPATVRKVHVRLTKGHTRILVTDPSQLGLAATLSTGTIFLDRTDIGDLTIDPMDSTRLLISSDNPILALVQPGSILLAGITPATPRGLLRKVVSVEPGITTTALVTVPATLDDAFDTLDVEVEAGSAARRAELGKGPQPQIKFDGGISVNVTEDVATDFENLTGVHPLSLVSSLSLGVQLALGIHTGKKYLVIPTLKSAHAELSGTLDIDGRVSIDEGFSISKSGKITALPRFDIGLPIEIAPGVVVQPAFEVDAGIEDSFGSAIDADGHLGIGLLVGVQCHGTDCSPELGANFNVDGSVDIDQTAGIGVFVEPTLVFKIDEIVSLEMGPQVVFGLNANLSADPWWTLEGDLIGDVAVDMDLGIVDFTPIDVSFNVASVTIAQASGPFSTTTTTVESTSTTTTTTDSGTTTTTTTLIPGCGNGSIDPGEQCDDGASLNGTITSCCTVDCMFAGPGTRCVDPNFPPAFFCCFNFDACCALN